MGRTSASLAFAINAAHGLIEIHSFVFHLVKSLKYVDNIGAVYFNKY